MKYKASGKKLSIPISRRNKNLLDLLSKDAYSPEELAKRYVEKYKIELSQKL